MPVDEFVRKLPEYLLESSRTGVPLKEVLKRKREEKARATAAMNSEAVTNSDSDLHPEPTSSSLPRDATSPSKAPPKNAKRAKLTKMPKDGEDQAHASLDEKDRKIAALTAQLEEAKRASAPVYEFQASVEEYLREIRELKGKLNEAELLAEVMVQRARLLTCKKK